MIDLIIRKKYEMFSNGNTCINGEQSSFVCFLPPLTNQLIFYVKCYMVLITVLKISHYCAH